MYNEELYKRLEAEFDQSTMKVFAEVMTRRHELLYLEHLADGLEDFTEEDHERDWWMNKYQQITTGVFRNHNDFDEQIEQSNKID